MYNLPAEVSLGRPVAHDSPDVLANCKHKWQSDMVRLRAYKVVSYPSAPGGTLVGICEAWGGGSFRGLLISVRDCVAMHCQKTSVRVTPTETIVAHRRGS